MQYLDLRGQFARAQWRRTLTYGVFALLVVVAVVLVGDELAKHFTSVETEIAGLGLWGVLVFAGLFVVATSLLIPESVLSVMAGALFGLVWGLVAVVISNLLAAAFQYFLSRRLLRGAIERVLFARPALRAIQTAVLKNDLKLQCLLRLTPLNPASISYVLGAAGVRFPGFIVACLAFFPHMAMEVYLGYVGRHAVHIAGRESRDMYLHDGIVFGGFAITLVAVFLISGVARRAVRDAVADTAS